MPERYRDAHRKGLERFLADRQRLGQVLLNLLSNGVKYNVDKGMVTVTCARPPASASGSA